MLEIRMIEDACQKQRIARDILCDLPEWFGIPESRENYIREARELDFFAALQDGEPIGFMTLKGTSAYTAEIHVCGVKKSCHRTGAGRAMFEKLKAHAASRGYEFLQVKTVAAGCYAEYDATRMFYEQVGFRALEVFPTLWDEGNPCLIMVQRI